MTTQEAHIELDLLLQKVNTHWNQNFLPQEKDLFLNREVIRFIKQRLNRLSNIKGQAVFDTIKRTADLVPLLKTVSVPIIKENTKEAKFLLPFDFLYYVSSDVSVCCTCTNKKEIKQGIYTLEVIMPRSLSELPLVIKQQDNVFSIEETDIPSDYLIETITPTYKNSIMLIKAIMTIIKQKNNTDLEFKYDTNKRKLIVRGYKTFSINKVQAKLEVFDRYEDFKTDLFAEVRLEDEEVWRTAVNSHFTRSTDQSMLAYLRQDFIGISLPKGVVYGTANLRYISKPNTLDLSLGSDCNLTYEVMEEIVANTAQRLHAVIGTDNYEKYVRENILIE